MKHFFPDHSVLYSVLRRFRDFDELVPRVVGSSS